MGKRLFKIFPSPLEKIRQLTIKKQTTTKISLMKELTPHILGPKSTLPISSSDKRKVLALFEMKKWFYACLLWTLKPLSLLTWGHSSYWNCELWIQCISNVIIVIIYLYVDGHVRPVRQLQPQLLGQVVQRLPLPHDRHPLLLFLQICFSIFTKYIFFVFFFMAKFSGCLFLAHFFLSFKFVFTFVEGV